MNAFPIDLIELNAPVWLNQTVQGVGQAGDELKYLGNDGLEAQVEVSGIGTAYTLPLNAIEPAPSAGHPISFGDSLTPLLQGQKTVTRRAWEKARADWFAERFEALNIFQVFDKGRGGLQVGWLRMTQKPYLQKLDEMSDEDLKEEGFPELTKEQFVHRFFDGNFNQKVWVIRFEFQRIAPVLPESLKTINPRLLSPFPGQFGLFGENEDITDLKSVIEASGIIKPVTVDRRGVIISGHSRTRAAIELEWDSIEIEVRNYASEEQKELDWLLSNVYRTLTSTARVRMYDLLRKRLGRGSKETILKSLGVKAKAIEYDRSAYTKIQELPQEQKEIATRVMDEESTRSAKQAIEHRHKDRVFQKIEEQGLTAKQAIEAVEEEVLKEVEPLEVENLVSHQDFGQGVVMFVGGAEAGVFDGSKNKPTGYRPAVWFYNEPAKFHIVPADSLTVELKTVEPPSIKEIQEGLQAEYNLRDSDSRYDKSRRKMLQTQGLLFGIEIGGSVADRAIETLKDTSPTQPLLKSAEPADAPEVSVPTQALDPIEENLKHPNPDVRALELETFLRGVSPEALIATLPEIINTQPIWVRDAIAAKVTEWKQTQDVIQRLVEEKEDLQKRLDEIEYDRARELEAVA